MVEKCPTELHFYRRLAIEKKTLNILGCDFTFELTDIAPNHYGQMRFGFMDAPNRSISMHCDTHPTWQPYLLLHEIIHALSFMGHLQFLRKDDNPLEDDESKVDAVASLLAHVLVSNHLLNMEVLIDKQQETQ